MTDDDARIGSVRSLLLDVPTAAPTDDSFAHILTSGRRRKRRRTAAVTGLAAIAVAAVTTVALAVPGGGTAEQKPAPAATGGTTSPTPTPTPTPTSSRLATMGTPCSQSDINANLGGGMLDLISPRKDSYSVRIITTKACDLIGPLRLEMQTASGDWQQVPPDPNWKWASHPSGHDSAERPQDATPTPLDPSIMYSVDLGWSPTKNKCAFTQIRLVSTDVTLPLGGLYHWCLEPVAVSNTYEFTQTRSIDWTLDSASGKTVTVSYQPQCHGARAEAIENSDSVTIVVLFTDILRVHGCLPIGPANAKTTVTLKAPVGTREIKHARTGPWQAQQLPPVAS